LFDAGANTSALADGANVGDYPTLAWTITPGCWCTTMPASICCPMSAGTARRSCSKARQCAAHRLPLHRWTYDLKGELLGRPHFAESPCVKLRQPRSRVQDAVCRPRNPRQDLARSPRAD